MGEARKIGGRKATFRRFRPSNSPLNASIIFASTERKSNFNGFSDRAWASGENAFSGRPPLSIADGCNKMEKTTSRLNGVLGKMGKFGKTPRRALR